MTNIFKAKLKKIKESLIGLDPKTEEVIERTFDPNDWSIIGRFKKRRIAKKMNKIMEG